MTGHNVDVSLLDEGTIVVLQPGSRRGATWLRRNLTTEPWQHLGRSIAVEPRSVEAIVTGLAEDGLAVEVAD